MRLAASLWRWHPVNIGVHARTTAHTVEFRKLIGCLANIVARVTELRLVTYSPGYGKGLAWVQGGDLGAVAVRISDELRRRRSFAPFRKIQTSYAGRKAGGPSQRRRS